MERHQIVDKMYSGELQESANLSDAPHNHTVTACYDPLHSDVLIERAGTEQSGNQFIGLSVDEVDRLIEWYQKNIKMA